MIDLDYKNISNDYIIDIFYGYENDFYIGIKYKDGEISKVPFTIHNYNTICSKLEKQYYKFFSSYSSYKISEILKLAFKCFYDLLCFFMINGVLYSDNKIFNDILLIISGIILLSSVFKKGRKLQLKFNDDSTMGPIIEKYLKNKENFLIELPNGEFTYALNIANISGNEMPYVHNKEIKGQIKMLRYISEKENSRDD